MVTKGITQKHLTPCSAEILSRTKLNPHGQEKKKVQLNDKIHLSWSDLHQWQRKSLTYWIHIDLHTEIHYKGKSWVVVCKSFATSSKDKEMYLQLGESKEDFWILEGEWHTIGKLGSDSQHPLMPTLKTDHIWWFSSHQKLSDGSVV